MFKKHKHTRVVLGSIFILLSQVMPLCSGTLSIKKTRFKGLGFVFTLSQSRQAKNWNVKIWPIINKCNSTNCFLHCAKYCLSQEAQITGKRFICSTFRQQLYSGKFQKTEGPSVFQKVRKLFILSIGNEHVSHGRAAMILLRPRNRAHRQNTTS